MKVTSKSRDERSLSLSRFKPVRFVPPFYSRYVSIFDRHLLLLLLFAFPSSANRESDRPRVKDRLEEAQNRIDEIEIFRGRQTRRFDYATNNLFFSSSFVPYFFRFLLFDHPRVNARALLFPFRVLGFTIYPSLSFTPTDRPSKQPTNRYSLLLFVSFFFHLFRSVNFVSRSSPLPFLTVRGDHDSSRISLDWKGIRSSYPIVYGNFVHNNSREIVSRSRIIYRKF